MATKLLALEENQELTADMGPTDRSNDDGTPSKIRMMSPTLAESEHSSPALAETLGAEAARRFVLGKLFAFTCFDGTRGAGRVYDDGSVIGVIQFQGSGLVRSAWLPP